MAVSVLGAQEKLEAGPRGSFQAHFSLIRLAFLSAGDIIYSLIYLFKELVLCTCGGSDVVLDNGPPSLNVAEWVFVL